MRYFQLTTESDPKVIGVRNGVHQGEIKWKKFKNKSSQTIIQNYFSLAKLHENKNEVEKFEEIIEYVEAYKGANITDFFAFTSVLWGVDFFISEKAIKVLEKFNLPTHSFFPVNIYHREQLYKYWAFYIPFSYREDNVDFRNSVFYEKQGLVKTKEVTFKNKSEYLENRFLGVKKLTFNSSFDKTLDLFTTMFSSLSYYISEKLKSAIVENKLTGFKLKEIKDPEIYW